MLLSKLTMIFNKKRIAQRIQNEEYLNYPLMWSDSSCAYGKELIQYLHRNEYLFRNILKLSERTAGETDILSIDGIYNSKTDLSKYASLHEFSLFLSEDGRRKFRNQNAIEFCTEDDLKKNCAFVEEDIPNKIKYVKVQNWNGKKYIANDNGSHHLAAIYRQCREQDRTYQLSLDITYESIDSDLLRHLLQEYYLVFSHVDNLYKLVDLYPREYSNMYEYDLNIQNRKKGPSQILPLKKKFPFNELVVDLLGSYQNQFIVLNNELKRLYL